MNIIEYAGPSIQFSYPERVRHQLHVTIDAETGEVRVRNYLTLPFDFD